MQKETKEISADSIIDKIRNKENIHLENKIIKGDLVFSKIIFNIDNANGNILGFKKDFQDFISPSFKKSKFSIDIKSKIIFYNCTFEGIVSLGGVNLVSPTAHFFIRFEDIISFEKSQFLGDVLCFSSKDTVFLKNMILRDTKFSNEPYIDNNIMIADFTGATINGKIYNPSL